MYKLLENNSDIFYSIVKFVNEKTVVLAAEK